MKMGFAVRFLQIGLASFLILSVSRVSADEVIGTPQCKMGFCAHWRWQNVEPVRFLKNAILMRFEVSTVEKKCNEAFEKAECRIVKPHRADYPKGEPGYALCSTATPMVAMPLRDPREKGRINYVVDYLNPVAEVGAFQNPAIISYFTVCHGWAPSSLDDVFRKFAQAKGYKPVQIAESQTAPLSEEKALALLSNASISAAAPSLHMLIGKWFATDSGVCKGLIGQTEGLLTFTATKFTGYESACDIKRAMVEKNKLKLSLACYAEGMVSKETALFEFVGTREVKRTTFDGNHSRTFTITRCP